MRCVPYALSLVFFFVSVALAAPTSKLPRAEFVNVMQGDYVVVGKKPDAQTAYVGRLTFRPRGNKLAFARTVAGRTVRGVATLELTATETPVPVLRMHFVQDGQRYEATFQWMIDLDNYARFTGYVYRPDGTTKEGGLEMLFPRLPSVRE